MAAAALAAFAECYQTAGCDNGGNITAGTALFGFLPVNVTSVGTTAPYIVTAFGASLGLTNADVSDCCTHNSFGAIGGLNIVYRSDRHRDDAGRQCVGQRRRFRQRA